MIFVRRRIFDVEDAVSIIVQLSSACGIVGAERHLFFFTSCADTYSSYSPLPRWANPGMAILAKKRCINFRRESLPSIGHEQSILAVLEVRSTVGM